MHVDFLREVDDELATTGLDLCMATNFEKGMREIGHWCLTRNQHIKQLAGEASDCVKLWTLAQVAAMAHVLAERCGLIPPGDWHPDDNPANIDF